MFALTVKQRTEIETVQLVRGHNEADKKSLFWSQARVQNKTC